jgi:mevalonate kinase
MISVSAPAKIHFSGEHSVVHGKPALIAAVDRRLTIEAKPRTDEIWRLISQDFKKEEKINFAQISSHWQKSNQAWEKFDSQGKINFLKEIAEPFGLVKIAIREAYAYLKQSPNQGWEIKISSQIPVGSGMGSSAALAAALVGTVLKIEGKKLDLELINKLAYQVEKKQHGYPSGGDNTVIVYGGLVRFQKKQNGFILEKVLVKNSLPEFMIVNSGTPAENTGEMVKIVKLFVKDQKEKSAQIIDDLGKVTEEIIASFKKREWESLKHLIWQNQLLLEKMGVVGKRAKKLVRQIKAEGGIAKICGAGGVKTSSGVILAYHQQPEKLAGILKKMDFFEVRITDQGVRSEKI